MSKHLSVIIITYNEEARIRRCLESLKWADEIIIFDSGSTDQTLAICKQYTSLIWQTDWPGYGPQKQRALEQATGTWVLSVDADEVVSQPLQAEILAVTQAPDALAGYQLARPLVFYGQVIRYANGQQQCLRLVRRHLARFTADAVHESLLVDGAQANLKQPLYHYSVDSVHDMLKKMNHYTDLSAEQKFKAGKRGSLWRAVLAACWMFVRVYVLQAGFLDGAAGLVLAMGFAEGAFYRYAKLYYLAQAATYEASRQDNQRPDN